MSNDSEPCVGCGGPGKFSILVAETTNNKGAIPSTRYYLPNQLVREQGKHRELWFCHKCMRTVEDSFRATIVYLQSENGVLEQ